MAAAARPEIGRSGDALIEWIIYGSGADHPGHNGPYWAYRDNPIGAASIATLYCFAFNEG